MQKKRVWICILALTLAITAISCWLIHENRLNQAQQDALAELDRNAGQYDTQSIVLHNTSKVKAEELAKLYGAKLRITKDGKFATLTLPEGATIRDAYAMDESRIYIDDMSADYHVQVSELTGEDGERLPSRPQYSVSDADYELQSYLDYLNMNDVWNMYTGSGITVAVIDTGIDTDHPEFAGRISEYSYNATEDKIVKDYNDWSLIEDEQGHGTAVTGVIAASMNSGNVVGIAPDAQILVIKAECDATGTFKRTSDLVFGLYYAIERGAHVVNMSFGTYGLSNPFAEATQLAVDSDIVCVAAAGNDATSAACWPAADENVIGVGALGDGWSLASYSNYGDNTDLVAPGTTYTSKIGGDYGISTGTSLASPVVAGAIALLLQNNVYTTFEDVTEVLYASCYDLGDLGRDWDYGFGALDISALVLEQRGKIYYEMLTDEVDSIYGVFIQGHTLQELPEPERLYAVFDGWYYDDTFTQEYNYYEDKFYGEVTLYAKWVNEDDGIPYTYVTLDDGTVEIRSYTGRRRYITIPAMIDGKVVSSIGDFAFENQSRLREVTLPAGLTNIGRYAFSGCNNLVSIRIPKDVTQIGECAFFENTRLRTVAFMGNKLHTIGDFAFAYSGIDRIELPASVSTVNGSTFYGATNLYEIKVQSGNTAFVSQDGVLLSKDGSTLIAFPAAWGSSYSVPASVTTIGNHAFGYAKLSTVSLEGVQIVGEEAFSYTALESVKIPDSVVSLGKFCFSGSSRLSSVTIGTGIREIPASCFALCINLHKIHIPSNVTYLGSDAFSCSGMKEVSFAPNSMLEGIGAFAFYNCEISQIDIPDSVESIGDYAFSGEITGNPLIHVGFGSGSALRSIGGCAFSGCWLLQNIHLPSGLQIIGELAFQASGLTAITVPASVTELGNGAFASCSALPAVSVAAANPVYHDIGGVVYNLSNTTIHAYPAGRGEETYTLESTTQTVAPYTFTGANNLYTIHLPDGLTQISEYAFFACANLQNIYIPDNVVQIGRYAFANDWNLTVIEFGWESKLPRIGYGAFAYCGVYDLCIPANVSTVGQDAFYGCKNLTYASFAANSKLESVPAYLFNGCDNLVQLTFEPGSALKSIQAHGLEGMPNLVAVDFGDAKLENVDNFAFRFCTNLAYINLPETVINIGRYAFYGCQNLTSLTLPASVEHIGSYAFLKTGDLELYMQSEAVPAYLDENWDYGLKGYYTGVSEVMENGDFRYAVLPSGNVAILEYMGSATHVDLTQVNLGGNIVTIGGSAFENSTVSSIVLPDTLTQIQAEAFLGSKLTAVTIPANVNFIGREAFANSDISSLIFAPGSKLSVLEQYAFKGTKNLTSVALPASLTTMGTGVFLNSGLQSVTFASGIGITEIPQNAFAETKLTSVALPDSVTLVNHNAFANVRTLKSVSFGNNAGIRLMSNAFYHTGLESLHIPANVTYIGEYCFVALPNLTGFSVDANNPNYMALDGLLLSKDGRKLVAVPAGRTGSLTVPLSVEEIGFGAFEESKLSEVKFHENANILSLGYRAFFKAENITTITIPKSVVTIDYYAFAYCENLKEVIFAEDNQLKGIYEGAFCGDANLESIVIPDSIVEISDWAFYGCKKIDEIPISTTSTLKGIYSYAFAYTGLNGAFTTPETLIDIGDYAFLGNKFTSVTVPDTNKKDLVIGIGAFDECNQLTEITLPFVGASYEDEKISWFGYIFGAGTYRANNLYIPESLKTVTITEGIQSLYVGAFYDVDTPNRLYLPTSLHVIWPDAFVSTGAYFELDGEIALEKLHYEDNFFDFYFQDSNISGHVTLASGIHSVPKFLFSACRNLRTVTIPEGVTTIEIAAFQSSGLTSVTIPKSVCVIEDGAFNGCSSLLEIINNSELDIDPGSESYGCVAENAVSVTDCAGNTVYKDNNITYLRTEDGFLFEKHGSDYILTHYIGDKTSVTLPTNINGKSYTIHKFRGATTVTVPGELKYVNTGAFGEGSDVRIVTLGEGITTIEHDAFYGSWVEHVYLPSTLKTIGNNAFYFCHHLEKIHLPKQVKTIGSDAFALCSALDMTVDPDNPYFTEIDGVVYNKAVTQMIHASHSRTEIVVPKTVTSLTLANHPNLKTVSFEAGSKLTHLNYNTFLNCVALESVILPEGLETMNAGAFQGCVLLKELRIPSTVKSMDRNPFNDSGIENLIVDDNHKYYTMKDGVLYNKSLTEMIAVLANVQEVVVPASVTKLYDDTFDGCLALTRVDFEIGSQLTEIPAHCFFTCSGLSTVTLPENLTSIGDWAFNNVDTIYNRSNLILTFGSEEHGRVAENARRIIDKNGEITYNVPDDHFVTDDGFVYRCTEGQYYLVSYVGELDTVTLPLSINGEPYTICEMAGVENVIFPEGFTRIDANAFWENKSLKSVVIPDTVTEISSSAFQGCSALKSVVIPDSVEYIMDSAFWGCVNLKDISFRDGVYIGDYAFDNTGYTNDPDNWVNGCCYIGKNLIDVDENLTRLVVRPDTLSACGSAFDGLFQLTYLDLGGLSDVQLGDCMNLETMVIHNPTQWRIDYYFSYAGSVPMTLKNIVLTCDTIKSDFMFDGITDVTIFVTSEKEAFQWDDNYPGWNKDNKVSYGGDWIWVNFYDQNGALIRSAPQRSSAIIRLPYVEVPEGDEECSYEFTGWDIDGDGEADSLPAISTVEIHAYAVIKKVEKQYSIVFMDEETGVIYHRLKAPKGAFLYTPSAPTKEDATFLGWGKYGKEGTIYVTGDMTIYAEWHYHSYESTVTPPACEAQGYTMHTCRDCGFQKKDSFIDALGHSFTDYVSDGNGTCQADGTKTASCDHGCGKTDTVADPGSKTDHQYGDWYVVKPSTETEEGLKRRDCKHCDHFEEVVTPIQIGPDELTSDVFAIGEGTVSKIPVGTTVADFLNGINDAEYVKIFKDGKEVASTAAIGTGMEVHLVVGDAVVQTLTVIVTGDTNGDGAITITDMLAIKSHVLKKSTLEGAYFTAGDTSDDGAISITDFIQVKAQILGKSEIVPHNAEPVAVETVQTANAEHKENTVASAEIVVVRPVAALLPKPMKKE